MKASKLLPGKRKVAGSCGLENLYPCFRQNVARGEHTADGPQCDFHGKQIFVTRHDRDVVANILHQLAEGRLIGIRRLHRKDRAILDNISDSFRLRRG
ncbi:hypothetical protein D3C84_504820 [compost metagenome]